jgi:hypothetical protein
LIELQQGLRRELQPKGSANRLGAHDAQEAQRGLCCGAIRA